MNEGSLEITLTVPLKIKKSTRVLNSESVLLFIFFLNNFRGPLTTDQNCNNNNKIN